MDYAEERRLIGLTTGKLANAFGAACANNKLDVVKFILTNDVFENKIKIDSLNHSGICSACGRGYLELTQYLLTSTELKEHSDIHAQNDTGFKNAYLNKHYHILEYLICEYKIDLNESLQYFIKDKPDLISMFALRGLNNNLNQNLKKDNNITSKVKI